MVLELFSKTLVMARDQQNAGKCQFPFKKIHFNGSWQSCEVSELSLKSSTAFAWRVRQIYGLVLTSHLLPTHPVHSLVQFINLPPSLPPPTHLTPPPHVLIIFLLLSFYIFHRLFIAIQSFIGLFTFLLVFIVSWAFCSENERPDRLQFVIETLTTIATTQTTISTTPKARPLRLLN